jgi:hypothetical protein
MVSLFSTNHPTATDLVLEMRVSAAEVATPQRLAGLLDKVLAGYGINPLLTEKTSDFAVLKNRQPLVNEAKIR